MKVGKFVIAIELWESSEDVVRCSYAKTGVGSKMVLGVGKDRLAAVIDWALCMDAKKGLYEDA